MIFNVGHGGGNNAGADYILEQSITSEKDAWSYRKWASGYLEYWYITSLVNVSFTSGTGGGYSPNIWELTFPIPFVNDPIVLATARSQYYGGCSVKDLSTNGFKINCYRYYSNNSMMMGAEIYCTGMWK